MELNNSSGTDDLEEDTTETKYFELKAVMTSCKMLVSLGVEPMKTVETPASMKLPQIELPTFSGEYESWLSHCD
jgi:hypothetical protein